MHCEYGGEVTLTRNEPGYVLRIINGGIRSIILSTEDMHKLRHRIEEVMQDAAEEEEEENPHD